MDASAPLHQADVNILSRLRFAAEHSGNNIAFGYLGDGEVMSESISYATLYRKASQLAATLIEKNLSEQRVILCIPQDIQFIVAFFACLYARAIAVPVLVPRPNRSLSTLLSIMKDCHPALIISIAEIERWLAPALRSEGSSVAWHTLDISQDVAADIGAMIPDSQHLAFLQYTSGSTALPKGVMVSHQNISHNMAVIAEGMGHDSKTIMGGWLPLSHDMGLVGLVLQPVFHGIPSFLMPPGRFLQKPVRWLRMISKYRITTSGAPNFAYDLCTAKVKDSDLESLDLRSWRVAFNGAEPVKARTLTDFSTRFRDSGFGDTAFFPCYGLAETTLMITGAHCTSSSMATFTARPAATIGFDNGEQTYVSCGTPCGGMEFTIVDPETSLLCSEGLVGEVWIAGPSVSRGYFGRGGSQSDTFRAVVAEKKDSTFFRTGDLGFLKSGCLYICGRIKDVIIIRGMKYHSEDIERVAAERVALISDLRKPDRIRVAAIRTSKLGSDGVSLAIETESHTDKLILRNNVPQILESITREFGISVQEVVILSAGSFDRTTSGKLKRAAITERYLQGEFSEFIVLSETEQNLKFPLL
jgi:acyl-CoA synthetase (AMP-forming)/AMP-acid ligase II